jgi:RNA polymerase sigma-70 factor (subfamily 1)
MSEDQDHQLARAAGGDQEALTALLREHGPAVRGGLRGRIPTRWQVLLSEDDVMQQTYADAVANIGQFRGDSTAAFVDWLKKIAGNNLRDAVKGLESLKRGGDRRQIIGSAWDESALALVEQLTGPGTSPTGNIARREAIAAMKRAIAQLPEVYARVVTMYDLERRSVEEVADALGRSPGAVFMLRARAHDRLHELMGHTSKFYSSS